MTERTIIDRRKERENRQIRK